MKQQETNNCYMRKDFNQQFANICSVVIFAYITKLSFSSPKWNSKETKKQVFLDQEIAIMNF